MTDNMCVINDRITHAQVVKILEQKLPDCKYVIADISCEEWREVKMAEDVYRIDNPVTLIIRRGGTTHRVVDDTGVVHCYVAPESGKSVLRWKSKDGLPPVRF